VRTIKLIGLAVTAALAVMAFAGVSSAMAESTLLCKNNTVSEKPTLAECGEVKEIHSVTVKLNNENKYVLGKLKMLSGTFGTIECHLLVKAARESGALTAGAAAFHVTLHYSECNLGCTMYDATGGPGVDPAGTLLMLRTGRDLATVTGDEINLTFDCGSSLKCDYNAAGLEGHGQTPNPVHDSAGKAHVTYTSASFNLTQKLSTGIFNCPSSNLLHILLQTLEPLYVRQ
jgi:hypothetical protein